jgi:hypothetical protein
MKAQTLQKRGKLSDVDQILKVLIAQEQAMKNNRRAPGAGISATGAANAGRRVRQPKQRGVMKING